MAYFRCGGNKPKEMVIKGASQLSGTGYVVYDLTIPCEEYNKMEVNYFDMVTVKISGIDSDGNSTVIANNSIKTKTVFNIDDYSKIRFYGLTTQSTFFNGFSKDIRFYN